MPHPIKKLEWDSKFFCLNIGEVILSTDERILKDTDPYDLLVLRQTINFDVKIPTHEHIYTEQKVTFQKHLEGTNIHNYEIMQHSKNPKTSDFYRNLSYESGKHSRFLLDKNFGRKHFERLYNQWVQNSVDGSFAQEIFYIEENGKAVGFATLQIIENKGIISLIAINSDQQGKGLGKKILSAAERYCIEHNILEMYISTQQQNIQACHFYEKMGYRVNSQQIIKHYWKKDDTI